MVSGRLVYDHLYIYLLDMAIVSLRSTQRSPTQPPWHNAGLVGVRGHWCPRGPTIWSTWLWFRVYIGLKKRHWYVGSVLRSQEPLYTLKPRHSTLDHYAIEVNTPITTMRNDKKEEKQNFSLSLEQSELLQ